MLNQLNIGKRLALSFAVVIAMFLSVGAVSLVTGARLEHADDMNTHTYLVIQRASGMLDGMINMETGMRGFLMSGDDGHLGPWVDGQRQFAENWQELKNLTSDNAVQQGRLAELNEKRETFRRVAEGLIAMRREVTVGAKPAESLVAEFKLAKDKTAMDGFRAQVAELAKMEQDLLIQRGAASQSLRQLNMLVTLIGSIIGLAIAVALGIRITRSITRPVQQAVGIAEAVASGNLSVKFEVSTTDETGRLLAALKRMSTELSALVGQVRSTSESIATGSRQIATGNADLSQRTEEQASNLQQTAASMEQLSSTVKNNADSARTASEVAGRASAAASKGGVVVGEVVVTMGKITSSSRKIGDIISVIDGIAFQTNILALNAAVEAARAGEQGRGFAVVASEVRSLAQRSASAAREIKVLINDSVKTVEAGAKQVGDAGQAMEDIVTQVSHVSNLLQAISASTHEQTTGIGQVSDAVMQLDQVTQQNAALVEESAAAAESLQQQATRLVSAVDVFILA
jgi:methyl-accepting chemotaxis protein